MPNWIEGTMKIRGMQENIKRFFREGVGPNSINGEVVDKSTEDDLYFLFCDCPHIKGTTRAFITDRSAVMDDGYGVVCIDIKQAWGFAPEEFESISEKYNVDIRLFGIECGMEFVQEVIIVRGENMIDVETLYEDWMWECPFPTMGG